MKTNNNNLTNLIKIRNKNAKVDYMYFVLGLKNFLYSAPGCYKMILA